MPPFPWHFGGQSHHNLFVDPWEIERFCTEHGVRVCLDVSHSQLACNHFGWSMSEFIETVGSHTAHLHIVDARGVDGEGLQIGDGDIDFVALCAGLDRTCPNASFVPEIWQGHKDNGAGFWFALDKLERWFENARAVRAASKSAPMKQFDYSLPRTCRVIIPMLNASRYLDYLLPALSAQVWASAGPSSRYRQCFGR